MSPLAPGGPHSPLSPCKIQHISSPTEDFQCRKKTTKFSPCSLYNLEDPGKVSKLVFISKRSCAITEEETFTGGPSPPGRPSKPGSPLEKKRVKRDSSKIWRKGLRPNKSISHHYSLLTRRPSVPNVSLRTLDTKQDGRWENCKLNLIIQQVHL